MHIRDGFLSPEVCLATGALSLGALAWSFRQLRSSLADRTVPLTGMTASLIFAGQMVNFPLPGLLVSGHLLGGVLAAALLGPWAGCIAISVVLFVQLALYYDGGWTVLGANIFNMGVVGCMGGYALYSTFRRWWGQTRKGTVLAASAAAWCSVVAASGVFAIEFACSFPGQGQILVNVFGWMLAYHVLIGLGEAIITGAVIGLVVQQRPELLDLPPKSSRLATLGRFTAGGLVAALCVAAFLAPFASEYADGLDSVIARLGLNGFEKPSQALVWNDYEIPAVKDSFPVLSVPLAGMLGTLVVLAVAWSAGWLTRRRPGAVTTGQQQHGG